MRIISLIIGLIFDFVVDLMATGDGHIEATVAIIDTALCCLKVIMYTKCLLHRRRCRNRPSSVQSHKIPAHAKALRGSVRVRVKRREDLRASIGLVQSLDRNLNSRVKPAICNLPQSHYALVQ